MRLQTGSHLSDSKLPARIVATTLRARLEFYDVSIASQELIAEGPIICVANHVCSLDSWVAFDVTMRWFHRNFLHIGENSVISRHRFLTRFGVLPVSAADPLMTMRSITAMGSTLRSNPDHAAWIFPTGSHETSLTFTEEIHGGVQALARVSGNALVVPVGLKY